MRVVTTFFRLWSLWHARLDLTVNFHHGHFIDPTNCPWASEDGFDESGCLAFVPESGSFADFVKQPKRETCF